MSDKIRIRSYNVRFGDAILVTVPDRDPQTGITTKRHILIDVGNTLNKEGGDDSVFKAVVDDVINELQDRPLDLYVMTHEHLDHVQGLYYVATKEYPPGEFTEKFKVDYAWLTASSHPEYYEKHPEAQRKKNLYLECYERMAVQLSAMSAEVSKPLKSILEINDPRSTGECIDFLRNLAPPDRTAYVSRGSKVAGKHPFREAKFEILAPEEDTSVYYRALLPVAGDGAGSSTIAGGRDSNPPPSGVDAGAFFDLLEFRRNGFTENILAIDKAANNSSVVFSLEWRNKRLLFSGDAELASWNKMYQNGLLKPVDYLKVAHHGSHNGTPDGAIFDAFLSPDSQQTSTRRASICVWENTYNGIPHDPTNQKLRNRCELKTTLDYRGKLFFDIEISA